MSQMINVKELRGRLSEIIKRVQQGDKFTVIYRSRPAFQIVPVDASEDALLPLADDPLYQAPPVGRTTDGMRSQDHDKTLYDS